MQGALRRFFSLESFHDLLKTEKTVCHAARFLRRIRIIWVRMMAVEELHDMEAAFVYIEVDVSCFKTGRSGLPSIFCSLLTILFYLTMLLIKFIPHVFGKFI